MKKMTILAVILALAVALTACGSDQTPETTAAATLPPEPTVPQPLALTDWTMHASTWSSPNGATVHIAATPNYYAEENQAEFVVRLESDVITSIPCEWNGTAYTAAAELNAANGYCYYVILTEANGTSSETPVNTPSNPVNEAFINMEAALESYCSITVEASDFDSKQLTLSSAKAQVRAPAITNAGETITCQEAVLILSYNGETLDTQTVEMKQTDTAGLYEADLSGTVFTLPEMEDDQKVELMMNATLSNGHSLSAYGGNWIFNDDSLLSVVG